MGSEKRRMLAEIISRILHPRLKSKVKKTTNSVPESSSDEGDSLSLKSNASQASSVIEGFLNQVPAVSETDEKLVDHLIKVDDLIKSCDIMECSDGNILAQVIQKHGEAADLIQKERKLEALVETAHKYHWLYYKAGREQAEIENEIMELDRCQKNLSTPRVPPDVVQKIRERLIQKYLEKVDERDVIVGLIDDLEHLMS